MAKSYPIITVLLAALAAAAPAWAGLGGAPGSSGAALPHAQAFEATPGIPPGRWTITRFVSSGGTEVREYSADGTVFGVAWSGPHEPDLKALLGGYYREWRAHLPQITSLRRSAVRENGLVVELGGHMGYVTGRAYVEPLAPAGVNPAQIVR